MFKLKDKELGNHTGVPYRRISPKYGFRAKTPFTKVDKRLPESVPSL